LTDYPKNSRNNLEKNTKDPVLSGKNRNIDEKNVPIFRAIKV
jgi:hypothetical protein